MPFKPDTLKLELAKTGIPVHTWGTGKAKNIEDLIEEIANGECILKLIEGKWMRFIVVAAVNVFYQQGKKKFLLVEDKQVFNDGRERKRATAYSISEKLKPGENSKSGAERALAEELGIKDASVISIGMQNKSGVSESFPGLFTNYIMLTFETDISQKDFKPEGYVERQKTKTTYFIWREFSGGS